MDWLTTLAVVVALLALLWLANYVLTLRDECARLREDNDYAWRMVAAADLKLERARSDAAIMAIQNMYLSQQKAGRNG